MSVAVDISRWQGVIAQSTFTAWESVGVVRVIVKAGGDDDSTPYKDPCHDQNVANAHAAGLTADRYWFNGQYASLAQQASLLKSIVNATLHPDEMLWMDVEGEGSMAPWSPSQCLEFVDVLGYPRGKVGLYASQAYVNQAGFIPVANAGVPLWEASYGWNTGKPGTPPNPWPWSAWLLWQYTSNAILPGYGGRLDLSAIGGTPVIGFPTSDVGYNASAWSTLSIQHALNLIDGAGLAEDGSYGPATTAAVHAFEVKYGLSVDVGIAGPEVVGKLAALLGISPSSATSVALRVDGIFGPLTVAAEQRALIAHGLSVGPTGADGSYGPDTIRAEQQLTGAVIDGIDGPQTTRCEQSYLIARGFSCGPTGADGIKGPQTVMALQRALNAQRF